MHVIIHSFNFREDIGIFAHRERFERTFGKKKPISWWRRYKDNERSPPKYRKSRLGNKIR